MKNEFRMSLLLVASFCALLVLGSIENVKGIAVVWFIGLVGCGGAFALSLGSLIHMQFIKNKG